MTSFCIWHICEKGIGKKPYAVTGLLRELAEISLSAQGLAVSNPPLHVCWKMYSGDYKEFTKAKCYHDSLELLSTFWAKRWRKQPLWFMDFYRLVEETDESAINGPEFRVINCERVHRGKEKSQGGSSIFLFQIKKDVYQGNHFTLKITTSSDSEVWAGRSTRFSWGRFSNILCFPQAVICPPFPLVKRQLFS